MDFYNTEYSRCHAKEVFKITSLDPPLGGQVIKWSSFPKAHNQQFYGKRKIQTNVFCKFLYENVTCWSFSLFREKMWSSF